MRCKIIACNFNNISAPSFLCGSINVSQVQCEALTLQVGLLKYIDVLALKMLASRKNDWRVKGNTSCSRPSALQKQNVTNWPWRMCMQELWKAPHSATLISNSLAVRFQGMIRWDKRSKNFSTFVFVSVPVCPAHRALFGVELISLQSQQSHLISLCGRVVAMLQGSSKLPIWY